jgi:uncharacterized membrane protein/protein-disulfide isomerase
MTHSPRSWPWWRWILTALSALGLALSAYLGWHHLTGAAVIGCGEGSSCDLVLSSRWSAIGGIVPVSGLAAGTYLAMLVASLFVGPTTAAPDRRLAWSAMLVLSGAAAGSAVWFTIVQTWIVGAFCRYCIATHMTGLLLAGLILYLAPMQRDSTSTNAAAPRRLMGFAGATARAIIGLALAGVLVAGQLAFAPPPVYRGGASQLSRAVIDPHVVPLVGWPDAPYVVTLLFDYKCPHCQQLHSMLDEVIGRYDGKLAFVLAPSPMNNRCNPYIVREVAEFKDSCELTKIALAVWLADREAFAAFDRWMFSPDPAQPWQARSLDAAKAKAVELVGAEKFQAAQNDPWIARYMQTSVQLYGDTIHPTQGGNAVPKLVFGARWVTPQVHDASDLLSILHDALNVPNP